MQRILLILGVVGGAMWIALGFVPAECAPPSGSSEVFCNRLLTPALAAMTLGAFGLRAWSRSSDRKAAVRGLTGISIGFALMTVGNGAEYWSFSTWPHGGANGWLRGILWMSVLAGWFLIMLSTLVTGFLLVVRRSTALLTGLGFVFMAVLPLTVIAAVGGNGIALSSIGVLALTGAALALLAPRFAPPGTGAVA